MTEGQKTDISLESSLDIKSSDMLVSIDEPKFQHNRQQYQGHYMPSSLRYEHDGWAVGWDVYDFKFKYDDFTTTDGLLHIIKNKMNSNPSYLFTFQKEVSLDKRVDVARIWWNTISSATNGIDTLQDGSAAVFTGILNDKRFTITIDPVHNIQTIDNSDMSLNVVLLDSGKRQCHVIDNTKHYTFDLSLKPASGLYNGNILFSQLLRIDGDKYVYDRAILENNKLYIGDKLVDYEVENGVLSATFMEDYIMSLQCAFNYSTFFPFLKNITIKYGDNNQPLLSNVPEPSIFDKYAIRQKPSADFVWTSNNNITLEGYVPIWHGKSISLIDSDELINHPLDSYNIADAIMPISNIHVTAGLKLGKKIKMCNGNAKVWVANEWDHILHVASLQVGNIQYPQLVYKMNIKCTSDSDAIWHDADDTDFVPEGYVWCDAGYHYNNGSSTGNNRYAAGYYYNGNTYLPPLSADVYRFMYGFYNDAVPYKYNGDKTYTYKPIVSWAGSQSGNGPVYGDEVTVTYPEYVSAMRPNFDINIDKTIDANNISSAYKELNDCYTLELSIGDDYIDSTRYHISNVDIHFEGNYKASVDNNTFRYDWDEAKVILESGPGFSVQQSDQIYNNTGSNDKSYFSAVCYRGWFKSNIYFNNRLTEGILHDKFKCIPANDIDNNKTYVDRGDRYFIQLSIPNNIVIVNNQDTVGNIPVVIKGVDGSNFYFYTSYMSNNSELYCPPILYYNDINKVSSSSDSMQSIEQVQFNIAFKTQRCVAITSATPILKLPTGDLIDHNFKKTIAPGWKNNIDVTITSAVSDDGIVSHISNGEFYDEQDVYIKISNNDFITLHYNTHDNSMTVVKSNGALNEYSYTANLSADHIKVDGNITVPIQYNLTANMAVLSAGNIWSANGSNYVCDYFGNSMVIDINQKTVQFNGKTFELDSVNGVYSCHIDNDVELYFDAVVKGPYKTNNASVLSFDQYSMLVDINNVQHSFMYLNLLNTKNNISYLYTDVTDEDMHENEIECVDPDEEFQFLKQQWDTTTVTENFWWVDPSHILLSTASYFILKEKTDTLDDWNGDVFVEVNKWPRKQIMVSADSVHMTSAYKGNAAMLYTITRYSDNTIQINLYDPLNDMQCHTVYIDIKKRELGDKLNVDNYSLYTYSNIDISSLLNSKFSATCIDDCILLGIHYDNNFNQWAIRINRYTFAHSILQGYGFVGIDGSLTGGEIPLDYFSNLIGFNSTVYPLSILKADTKKIERNEFNFMPGADVERIYEIDVGEIVVGTDAQQWYLAKKLSGIVSHLTWQNGTWVVQIIPITNNLAQNYKSASCAISKLSDIVPIQYEFVDLLPDSDNKALNIIKDILNYAVGDPSLWIMFPKMSFLFELQQTLGQAAYVHRNSTSVKEKDIYDKNDLKADNDMKYNNLTINDVEEKAINPLLSDELSFNTHEVPQYASVTDAYNSMLNIIGIVSGLLDNATITFKTKVNEHKNETSTEGENKQGSTYYLKNMDLLAATDINSTGAVTEVSQNIAGTLSLDMFYSTCNKQEISAGPGWVNHNFVAQCVSQSVTAHSLTCKQYGIMFIIKMLSIWQSKFAIFATDAIMQATIDGFEYLSRSDTLGTNWGAILAITGRALVAVEKATIEIQKFVAENLGELLDALGAGNVKTSVTYNTLSKNIDVEAKHAYGDKSECFMWPCFNTGVQEIPDETVEVVAEDHPWKLNMELVTSKHGLVSDVLNGVTNTVLGLTSSILDNGSVVFKGVTSDEQSLSVKTILNGDVHYYVANVRGDVTNRKLPDGMAYVIGCESFLSKTPYRNENISESAPVFPTHPFQDYVIDNIWQISQTASVGMTTWISCKDTKIIDGEMSNAVISDDFCGIAAPYCAIEVKKGIDKKYMRPYAITPNALALNNTGKNCCYDRKAYHAFDGYGYRIVNWLGASGMNKQYKTWLYSFLVNDRFKRSNKLPMNEYLGNFKSDPVVAITSDDRDEVFTLVTQPNQSVGLTSGTIGEDKDSRRYALPVFSEQIQTLPATMKTISSMTLSIIDGVTSLTTDNRDLQSAYKAPVSVDFTIGKQTYRYTQEYICKLRQEHGVTIVDDLVPCLGLTFIGSTPYEAYFYSAATRKYYTFTGGTALENVDTIERFRNITDGIYDFVNQEVVIPTLVTFDRLDSNVKDDADETDNVIVTRVKDSDFIGEIWPPLNTIYNTRSWYKILSLPSGVVYQGPNRCIINRSILQDYMLKQIKSNYGKWKRLPKEKYNPFRVYTDTYSTVDKTVDTNVIGWTHNPFLLVTAPLGVSENIDCIFEWEITFCWPVEMDKLYDSNSYAVVNIQAETMTPGGKVIADRPTHVYLTKDLFTRTNKYGYYSFRYQSNCGIGNRERLHIWSDQYICVSSLTCECKQITEKRTEILTQHVDVQQLHEI